MSYHTPLTDGIFPLNISGYPKGMTNEKYQRKHMTLLQLYLFTFYSLSLKDKTVTTFMKHKVVCVLGFAAPLIFIFSAKIATTCSQSLRRYYVWRRFLKRKVSGKRQHRHLWRPKFQDPHGLMRGYLLVNVILHNKRLFAFSAQLMPHYAYNLFP